MSDQTENPGRNQDLLRMTVDVVTAYVSNNAVSSAELPDLIRDVHASLRQTQGGTAVPAEKPKPAIAIKKSVTPDFVICLEDGRKLKMLKRHLRTTYGMTPDQYRARWGLDLWGALLDLQKPTMAAAHGVCFGSGVEIAALCDFRIASPDAVFALPEASLGLVPAAGGTQTLPRVVGLPRAMEAALTGRRVSAQEAHRIGFATWLAPRERLIPEAEARLRDAASAPPEALALVKRAVNEGADLTLAEGLRLERRLAAQLG